jgi:hypothetical protein
MMTRARALAVLALFAGCTASLAVSAGNLSFLERSPLTYFNSEDMDLMRENARKVLDEPGANAKQDWSNAKTGASGLAQVRSQFTATDGAPCKRLRVLNKANGLTSDATYTVCKYPERGWVVNTDATAAQAPPH